MSESFKYFYIDHNGNTVINGDNYQSVRSFSEGLAAVYTKGDRWGFIDKSGTVVIKPQFYEVGDFSQGLARVKISEKSFLQPNRWGYIDKAGNIVFETDYDALYDFSEDVAFARKNNEIFLIDKTGSRTFFFNEEESQVEFWEDPKFSNGLVVACDAKINKCGFMNKAGRFEIEPRFSNASLFSEGLARVSIIENHRELVGFINRNGEFVIPPKFDVDSDFMRGATDFSEGLASLMKESPTVEKDSSFVYIDRTGKIVIQTDFFYASPFSEDLASIYNAENGKYGFIDKSGKLVIPPKFDLADNFSEGLAIVAISIK